MCRICYGGVTNVTFYDSKKGEQIFHFDTMGLEVDGESLIGLEFDKVRGEIKNDDYWLPPHPIQEGKYIDLREDYSNEYIVAHLELGKFKAKNTIDIEDWLESFNRMRNGVIIGKLYYDERSVDNWRGRL